MAWRVARSLDTLLSQLNSLAPRRSKAADGSIGDAAHASRTSDHNPWYGPGIVTARDYTHDPAGGLDCNWLAGKLTASGDRRIKYIIWNRRIWQGSWQPYYGSNAHTQHLHLSVVASPACDDTRPWNLGATPTPKPEVDLLPDERNALLSLYGALFGRHDPATGKTVLTNGNQGDTSLLNRFYELQTNLRTLVGRPTVDVDERALAAALAPLLPDVLNELSDADVARVAKAAADETDRRARVRLSGAA